MKDIKTMQEVTDKKISRKHLTLFLIMFPSLLIAGDYAISSASSILLKGLLIFYQLVLLKSFLDDYYKSP